MSRCQRQKSWRKAPSFIGTEGPLPSRGGCCEAKVSLFSPLKKGSRWFRWATRLEWLRDRLLLETRLTKRPWNAACLRCGPFFGTIPRPPNSTRGSATEPLRDLAAPTAALARETTSALLHPGCVPRPKPARSPGGRCAKYIREPGIPMWTAWWRLYKSRAAECPTGTALIFLISFSPTPCDTRTWAPRSILTSVAERHVSSVRYPFSSNGYRITTSGLST